MTSTKFSRLLIFLLLPGVVWLFHNTIVNRHIHVLSDGYVLSHAHPINNTPGDWKDLNTHQHSRKQIMLLDLFYMIIISGISILVLRSFLRAFHQIIKFQVHHHVPAREHFQVYHYHAPPFQLGSHIL